MKKKDKIFVKTTVYLVYPYDESASTLQDMCNLWSIKLLECDTTKNKATIAFPLKVFKKMFEENPRVQEYEPLEGTERFIKKMIVKEIIVEENKKHGKHQMPQRN